MWPEVSLRNEKNGMVKDVCDVPGFVAEVVEPLCSTRIFGVSVSVVLLPPIANQNLYNARHAQQKWTMSKSEQT